MNMQSLARLLHADFCPGANRYVYWMKNPVWLLLASAIACGFVGVFVNPALFVVGGLILLTVAGGYLWPSLTLRFVDCDIYFERTRCREGESVAVRLTVRNRSWLPAWGLTLSEGFVSEMASASVGDSPAAALGRLPARGRSKYVWTFRPETRGVYPHGTPQLETRFPFGLSSARVEIRCENTLIVWPAVVALTATPESLTLSGREDRLSDRRAGDFGDVLGTRSFREGDSLRRVHWAQSARLGHLIVCERQAACTCTVTLHPDLHAASHAGGDPLSLERTLKITASLLHHFHHSAVGCVVVIGREQIAVAPGQRQAYRVAMDRLAKTPYGGYAELPAVRATSDADLVITTDQAHRTGPARTIVVETDSEDCPACLNDRIWCRVPVENGVAEFPRLWRRACGAA